jgi:hypothetical protein
MINANEDESLEYIQVHDNERSHLFILDVSSQ